MTTLIADEFTYSATEKLFDSDLKNSGAAIRVVACNNDSILTASSRPVVKIWQVAEAKVTEKAKLSYGAVGNCSVDVTTDGNLAAMCSDDGAIALWDLRARSRVAELASTISTAWKAKFLPEETRLVSGGPSGVVCIWDLRTSRLETELGASGPLAEEENGLNGFNGLNGLKRKAGEHELARQSKRRRGSILQDGLKNVLSPIFSLTVSPDGQYLGCGRGNGEINVLRMSKQQWAGDVRVAHGGESVAVRSIAFDSKSRFMLSGADDQHVSVLDAARWAKRRKPDQEKGQPFLERWSAHKGVVTSVSVCPDPQQPLAFSTSWDSTVKLWNYRTHANVAVFKEHTDSVLASAFEPSSGNFGVTVGADARLVFYKKIIKE